jgi:hypothetical protein
MSTIKAMLRRFQRQTLAVALAVAVVPMSRASQSRVDRIDLRLSLAQRPFLVGEPVRVCSTLTNATDATIQFRPISLVMQTMRFWIRSGDNPFERYDIGVVIDPTAPLALVAGSSYKGSELVHYDYGRNMLAFPVPGHYTIRAEFVGYFSSPLRPLTATADLDVVAPGAAELAAAALFARKETADFVSGFSMSPVVEAQLNRVSNEPSSVFGLYAKFFLAQYASSSYSGKSPNYLLATRLLNEAAKPEFQLTSDALLRIVMWSKRVRDAAAATAAFERLRREFPESCAAFDAERERPF